MTAFITKSQPQPEQLLREALDEWVSKTQWIQENIKPEELGLHRADVLKARYTKMEGASKEALNLLELIYLIHPTKRVEGVVEILKKALVK